MPIRISLFAFITLTTAAVTLQAAAPRNQTTFGSPQEAAQAMIDAAGKNDTPAMLKLFGPTGKDIVQSGDATADQHKRSDFAKLAHEKMSVVEDGGRATILVGPDEWPFPVPLVKENGVWRFDSAQGRVQILAHRIGENEINAMEACRGFVEAQREYAQHDYRHEGILQYAMRVPSTPGKKDGLYWEGDSDSPVSKAFAAAASASAIAGGGRPYHGYYFRVLTAQGPDAPGGEFDYVVKGKLIGGFALVAWPAEYGVSGVQTFLINHQGVVFGKDLGRSTVTMARQMTKFNPDRTWRRMAEELTQ